jgi:hypothetical protein
MKICFEHKTRMKVDYKIKVVRIGFLSYKLWLIMEHLLQWIFLCSGMHTFSFYLHSHKVLHNKWYSPHYVKQNDWKN